MDIIIFPKSVINWQPTKMMAYTKLLYKEKFSYEIVKSISKNYQSLQKKKKSKKIFIGTNFTQWSFSSLTGFIKFIQSPKPFFLSVGCSFVFKESEGVLLPPISFICITMNKRKSCITNTHPVFKELSLKIESWEQKQTNSIHMQGFFCYSTS